MQGCLPSGYHLSTMSPYLPGKPAQSQELTHQFFCLSLQYRSGSAHVSSVGHLTQPWPSLFPFLTVRHLPITFQRLNEVGPIFLKQVWWTQPCLLVCGSIVTQRGEVKEETIWLISQNSLSSGSPPPQMGQFPDQASTPDSCLSLPDLLTTFCFIDSRVETF